jgi:hypothetical protein
MIYAFQFFKLSKSNDSTDKKSINKRIGITLGINAILGNLMVNNNNPNVTVYTAGNYSSAPVVNSSFIQMVGLVSDINNTLERYNDGQLNTIFIKDLEFSSSRISTSKFNLND